MNLTTVRTRARLSRWVAAASVAAVLLLAATACGSDETNDNDATTTGQAGGQRGPQDQGGPPGGFPGANGKVAAVDGSTAQVQGMQGQVAVTWTTSTAFTKQVGATLSDVGVGDCVFVTSEAEQSPSDSPTPPTEVAADTVRITQPADGSCGTGARGPGGAGPQLDGTPPTDAPDGADRPQIRGNGGAVGEVTAVSSTGFTVMSVMPGSEDETTVTVTVDGGTTYSTTAKGTASDVEVGVCVQAEGDTDDTGAVTARTIAVSPPVDGECGGMVRLRSTDGGGAATQES